MGGESRDGIIEPASMFWFEDLEFQTSVAYRPQLIGSRLHQLYF